MSLIAIAIATSVSAVVGLINLHDFQKVYEDYQGTK